MLKVILTALAVCFAVPASAQCVSEARAYLELTSRFREVVIETETPTGAGETFSVGR